MEFDHYAELLAELVERMIGMVGVVNRHFERKGVV